MMLKMERIENLRLYSTIKHAWKHANFLQNDDMIDASRKKTAPISEDF